MQSPVFQTMDPIYVVQLVRIQQRGDDDAFGRSHRSRREECRDDHSECCNGGAAVMLLDHLMPNQKMEPRRMNNGVLCGLVSISGCAGMIDVWVSIIIGFVAGAVYVRASKMLVIFRVDDVVDAIPIHLFGGIWERSRRHSS